MAELKELVKRLAEAHGLSGHEEAIRLIIEDELDGYLDERAVDPLGNFIGTRHGRRPSVMLAAHTDEIGLMVKHITDEGFLTFSPIGGWFDQTLLNQRVILHAAGGGLYGVIGSKPPHVMKKPEEREKVVKLEDMFIDLGARSRDEVEQLGVSIGTPVTVDRHFVDLGNGRVSCKAFDNRAGVAVMIEALRRTKTDCQVYVVGTVQEEVGLKGARTTAYALSPAVALAMDVDVAGGHPGIEKKESPIELDKGPVLTVSDASGRGIITPPAVLKWLKGTAAQYKIAYQLSVADGGTTDASVIHLTKTGIPTGVVGVPVRYIHTPVELLSMHDLDRAAELVARALDRVSEYF